MVSSAFASVQSSKLKRRKFIRRELIPLKPSHLWRIDAGCVRGVTMNEEGVLSTLGFWRSGDVIGQFLSRFEPFQIECLTEVDVIGLPNDDLSCQTALACHFHQTQTLLKILNHKQVTSRLIDFLIWLANEFGHPMPQGYCIDLRLSHQDIAEAISSSRVTVTRLLNQFARDGVLMRHKRNLILKSDFPENWNLNPKVIYKSSSK